MRSIGALAVAAILGAAAAGAWAGERGVIQPADDPAVETESEWRFAFSPYVWLTSLSGSIGTRGVSTDVDASFLDIAGDTDVMFGLMGALDAEYGRLVFQFNAAWTYGVVDDLPGSVRSVQTSTDITTNIMWVELLGGWRFIDMPLAQDDPGRRFRLDGFAGARLTYLDMSADVTATLDVTLPDGSLLQASRTRNLGSDEAWVDPFFGARMAFDVTDRWEIALRGDIGGFGAGSQFTWQAVAGVGYNFEWLGTGWTAFVGFRALGQDYESDQLDWDVITYGPLFGVSIKF